MLAVFSPSRESDGWAKWRLAFLWSKCIGYLILDYLVEFHEQMMLVRLKQNDDKKLMEIIEEKLQPYLENKDIE